MPATSGLTCAGSSLSPVQELSFSRTSSEPCRTSSMLSCPSYRAWATPLRRDSLRRLKSARRTGGSGSSSSPDWQTPSNPTFRYRRQAGQMKRTEKLLPAQAETFWTTPQAHDAMGGQPERVRRHGTKHGAANLADDVTLWATPTSHPRTYDPRQVDHGEQLANQVALWATPTSRDWKDGANPSEQAPTAGLLGRQAPRSGIGGPPSSPDGPTSPRRWPTPRANDSEERGGVANDQRNGLPAAAMWQTPSVEDAARAGSAESWQQYREENRTTQARLRNQVHWPTPQDNDAEKCGQLKGMHLNPRFVCWLMNFPLGWTSLGPLESTSYERWEMQLSQLRRLWRF